MTLRASLMLAGLAISAPTLAAELTKPNIVLKETVTGLPRSEQQEIRVLTASFEPGQSTAYHTHRHPVTVYILEGTFTLEMEGRAPVSVSAGQSFVEPPGVKMTGYNRSTVEPIKLVIFYVSEPGAPFLDVIHP